MAVRLAIWSLAVLLLSPQLHGFVRGSDDERDPSKVSLPLHRHESAAKTGLDDTGSGEGAESDKMISTIRSEKITTTAASKLSTNTATKLTASKSSSKAATKQSDASSFSSQRNLQKMFDSLLSSQQEVLVELKSQIVRLSSRLDEQQASIDRHDQALGKQRFTMAGMAQKQLQTTSDIYLLKMAVVSQSTHAHEKPATSAPSSDRVKGSRPSRLTQELSKDLKSVESRVTDIEHVQTNLANVVQHLITRKIWESKANFTRVGQSEEGLDKSHLSAQSNHSNSEVQGGSKDETGGNNDNLISELEAQKVEERTNQVLSSIEKWNKVEKSLHTSLADLHTAHRRYDSRFAYLANYTLNNGIVIGQLAEARISDGNSILGLINGTGRLTQQLYHVKMAIHQNKNRTAGLISQTEQNLSQLLELIQLNSMKVTTLQDALKSQGSLFESQLNHTSTQLYDLKNSLSELSLVFNSTRSSFTERIQSNKEKSDMLWSRIRTLDNRLAHVEVKYLTQELNKYQKSNDVLRHSLKLMEIEDQLETVNTNIKIQQSNQHALERKINSVDGSVGKLASSFNGMKSVWAGFTEKLPALELMHKEVQSMISVLPQDCDGVHAEGVLQSGVRLVKPNKYHSIMRVVCGMEKDRGWTVVQHRFNGKLNFNRNWTEYRDGFSTEGTGEEFWLGNELVHSLTSAANYSVRFDMWTINGTYLYAQYEKFALMAESQGYKLIVTGYSGNATDSLKHSNNIAFSTIDKDNDMSSTHCAQFYTAGWWYKHCHYCNLNGRYTVGVVWFNHRVDDWMELKETTIRISRRR